MKSVLLTLKQSAQYASNRKTNNNKPNFRRQSITCKVAVACVLVAMVAIVTIGSNNNIEASNNFEAHLRSKRSLYELASGAEDVIGTKIRTTFTCNNLGYGYYADVDNDCKIFHICQSFKMSDGSIYSNHWSFFCGNQTIFNQATLSCSHPEDSVPCENARDFYHVNDYFGDVRAPSVKESDLSRANSLISRAYGARISTSPDINSNVNNAAGISDNSNSMAQSNALLSASTVQQPQLQQPQQQQQQQQQQPSLTTSSRLIATAAQLSPEMPDEHFMHMRKK